jgi:HPt (histidine-containing phosphotransfer) domain-containing protein
MTAYAMDEDKEKCLAAGMNDYITKPIKEAWLLSTLEKWIAPRAESKNKNQVQVFSKNLVYNEENDKTLLPDELPGIDMAAGLKRLGGNRHLYHKLLRHFYKDYHNVTTQINDALQNGDLEIAYRLAHTVNGIAANLSINNLPKASKALELALKTGDEIAPDLLKQFEKAVAEVMTTLATVGDDKAPGEEINCEKTDTAVLMPMLLELEKLLGRGSYRARERLQNIKCHLNRDLQPFYRNLKNQVDDFEFDAAQKTLAEMIKQV